MKVFIDGQAGTTGLKLQEKLLALKDTEILQLQSHLYKNDEAKKEIMQKANVIFLCLPDEAAKSSALLAPSDTLVIDASTAHRTNPNWVYGFPELSENYEKKVRNAKRISVPGCHATGFISIVYPLISCGLLNKSSHLTCTSLTGYSGGGKALIQKYEQNRTKDDMLHAPMPYALNLNHKHLKEMKYITGLDNEPHFYPVVGNMYSGMLVSVHIFKNQLKQSTQIQDIHCALKNNYNNSKYVSVMDLNYNTSDGFLDPTVLNGTNNLQIFVYGHNEQITVIARLDNLGKGASGAALQCMQLTTK